MADEHPAIALLRRILPAMEEADSVAGHEGQTGCTAEIAEVKAFLADIDKGAATVIKTPTGATIRENGAAPCSHPKISAYGAGEKAVCQTCGTDPRHTPTPESDSAVKLAVFEVQAYDANARRLGRADARRVSLNLKRYRVQDTRLQFDAAGQVSYLLLVDRRVGAFACCEFERSIDVRIGETLTLDKGFVFEELAKPKPIPETYSGVVKQVVLTTTDAETGQMQLWVDAPTMRAWVNEKPRTRHVGAQVLLEPFNRPVPASDGRSTSELY